MTILDDVHSVVFFGDSITDSGHREDPDRLGNGYVRLLADQLLDLKVINAGIGGNRAVDLQARLDNDVLAHRPELVSIMIGINDTWRKFDRNDPTSTEAYEASYRDLLTRITSTGARVILLEPFVLPVTDEQATTWRDDLDPKIDAVRGLAAEFDVLLVRLDVRLNQLASDLGAAALAGDGVHPSDRGHAEIARLWLETVGG